MFDLISATVIAFYHLCSQLLWLTVF